MSSIEEFKYYLLQGGRKPQTVAIYIDCFKRLQKAVPSLAVSDIQLYLIQLKEQGRITQGRKALEDLGFTVLESQEVGNKIRYVVVDPIIKL